jgi:hypothetical protein
MSLLQEIQNDEYTDADVRAVKKLWDRFKYTATFVSAVEAMLREQGDPKAADLVGSITNRLAKHESETA